MKCLWVLSHSPRIPATPAHSQSLEHRKPSPQCLGADAPQTLGTEPVLQPGQHCLLPSAPLPRAALPLATHQHWGTSGMEQRRKGPEAPASKRASDCSLSFPPRSRSPGDQLGVGGGRAGAETSWAWACGLREIPAGPNHSPPPVLVAPHAPQLQSPHRFVSRPLRLCTILQQPSITPTSSHPAPCAASPAFLSAFTLPLNPQPPPFPPHPRQQRTGGKGICMGTDLAGCIFQLFHFTGGELRPVGPLFPPRIRLEAERWLGHRALGFLLSISSFAREARQMQEQVRVPTRVCQEPLGRGG